FDVRIPKLGGFTLPKVKITISLDIDDVVWLDKEVDKGKFMNRSEAVQYCIKQMMKKGEINS
ncbi:MAG: ribbon-helix-helix domain-containing protein, partial [Nitrososphaerota archaeon]|nr:ribbon-helix-helix domain-containing protein [Nitrososphaerota archaeon]